MTGYVARRHCYSIGLDNGLAPTMRQAIIWTNCIWTSGLRLEHTLRINGLCYTVYLSWYHHKDYYPWRNRNWLFTLLQDSYRDGWKQWNDFIYTYIHTYVFVVVNFDALAQASDIRIERRQVVFLCWEQGSNPSGSQTPNRQQTECPLTNRLGYRGSSKNLNSTARPYDQRVFSPLDPTAVWHSHLALAIYMFVVVNFDALAQASDIRIERRQVVFLCREQDSNPSRSQTPNRQQTECPSTNRLSYRGSSKNWNSTARPYYQRAFSPLDPTTVWHSHLALAIYMLLLLISMLWHRQAIFESKGDKLSSSAESRIRTHQGLRHQIACRLNAHWQPDWAIEDQAKTWTRQPVPMISEHSAPLTPQPFGICTWLWRCTCLLLLISMLWHRQAIFESKGDKLSSSAESRIRTHQGLRHQIASRLNAHWQTDWAIEDQAKTWTRQPVPMISEHSAHLTPQPFGIRTWLWRYTCLFLKHAIITHSGITDVLTRPLNSRNNQTHITSHIQSGNRTSFIFQTVVA